MRRMGDDMHLPPASSPPNGGWAEVGGRARRAVALARYMRRPAEGESAALRGRHDLKLWLRRGASPQDLLTPGLRMAANTRRHRLEDSVRRRLRQLPPSALRDGPHAARLDCCVDLNRLFNERTGGGGALQQGQWTKLLSSAGLAAAPEDGLNVTECSVV
jgi:hypothetical protein